MKEKHIQFRVVPVDPGPLNKQWYGEIMWIGKRDVLARESGGFASPEEVFKWIFKEIRIIEKEK